MLGVQSLFFLKQSDIIIAFIDVLFFFKHYSNSVLYLSLITARLSRGYAALGALERQCAHLQFQEPRTKLWLFDTRVTPTLLYGVETWGPRINKANHWKDLETFSVNDCLHDKEQSIGAP